MKNYKTLLIGTALSISAAVNTADISKFSINADYVEDDNDFKARHFIINGEMAENFMACDNETESYSDDIVDGVTITIYKDGRIVNSYDCACNVLGFIHSFNFDLYSGGEYVIKISNETNVLNTFKLVNGHGF